MIRAIAVLIGALLATTALAQSFPTKPVRLIVPFAAGAGTDVVARAFTQRAADGLGQPIVVENRAGAAGNLGAEAAARAPADGYTITILSTIHAANQSFFRKLGYAMATDFVPIVEIGVSPTLWVVHPEAKVRDMAELAREARANPGKLTYGSGGATHPAELFRALTGAPLTVVPYKGVAAVMTDLLTGRIDMTVAGFLDLQAHLKSGKLRALAVTTAARLPVLPDVPTVAEFLPGYEFTLWYGLFAPKDTPAEAVDRVRNAVVQALDTPEVRSRYEALSIQVARSSREAFGARVRAEIDRWAQTVKKAGITPQD